ncbi:LuxR C-terminal-related transcriptional regulator [Ferdinandcohnia quinoae]|uniref:LuxR C-terminal-related transcriptional regulator n=1 Tax=Fredinandcohnia quinoae TaxID=2918902 RepID=A0AAW5E4K6_9BACI|nr:LuxR C-terminal-related transcriptional regulator [Fredinandcohnia sp. SECRCQ15]MCH1624520.1 LuxR C-terminal-related transcriptional regulator [Fredinandcohnia sp. SECRCQ15]
MTHPLHPYEEITFQQFILFIKSHNKQIDDNINIYLNNEPNLTDTDRKMVEALLKSFFRLLTSPSVSEINEQYEQYLDTWVQSQLAFLNVKSFNLFHLIFEKSIVTLMVNMKHAQNISILMFLQSIFSHLVHSYDNCREVENKTDMNQVERNRFQVIDKLNELLISSAGTKDFAHILKKCEEFFQYKRCVFYAYIPWSHEFYGVIGSELSKVQSMRGNIGFLNTIFHTKKPIFLKKPQNYVQEKHIKLFNLSSVIFVPIFHLDQVFGWMTFDQEGEEFDCSVEELALLELVGKRLGLFLSRDNTEVPLNSGLQLTEREAEILDLLAEGYDNKKMAELLYLSEHTIRDYVSNLMTKLKAKNRTQVVASAFRLGLLR